MARPQKDNADYFSHDADMRNDLKIKALRRKYSHTGYAVYNYMLELLTDSNFFQHKWDDLNIEIISGDFNIDPEILKEIIEYCTSTLQLFTIENGLIWCETLRKRFESLLSKRKRDRSRVFDAENPQSKGEESKAKKRKVKNNKFTPPTPQDVEEYAKEKGHKVDGKKICDYYTIEDPNKWIDKKGNEVKSWKRKVLSVWCKDENKIILKPDQQSDDNGNLLFYVKYVGCSRMKVTQKRIDSDIEQGYKIEYQKPVPYEN
jgi:hypothetical protein